MTFALGVVHLRFTPVRVRRRGDLDERSTIDALVSALGSSRRRGHIGAAASSSFHGRAVRAPAAIGAASEGRAATHVSQGGGGEVA